MKTLAIFLGLTTLVYAEEANFRAGAALSNITPKMGVVLDGTIMQIGPAKHVHDELWVRCLVLDDGATKLAFAEVDNTMVSRPIHDAAKAMIMKRVGIPPNHVCIAATHTHSTPRAVIGLKDDDLHREYLDDLAVKIADGVHRAYNNLAAAEIGWGSFREPRYVHNRRWRLKQAITNPFGESGEMVKMNPGGRNPNAVEPAGPVDDQVFVVALRQHDSGQPLAVLANYGLHYVGGVPRGEVSADYFAVFADRIQQNWKADRLSPPFVGIMTNGTSGDVNAVDFSKPRQRYASYERMTTVGQDLAEGAIRVIESMEFRSNVKLAAASADLELRVRKPEAERLGWAAETLPVTPHRLSLSQIYAREAHALAEFPDTVSVPIQAFRIGDLAIAQSPCETFAETGLKIKNASPFPGTTFTIELANGYNGYLPSKEQHKLGGYETWPARSSYLEVDAEQKIRDGLMKLLEQLKGDIE
ncbi:hypothetical protein [Thalassoroseus pseudoceratinae]|uniref:hypothetical protein n=1 Tax=Thalassoroseus pseudoceratinae TaxID=2713176 RepID=UPI00142014E1|nr:hypothetical protein [Thalassoroseus pseudoceratinae]